LEQIMGTEAEDRQKLSETIEARRQDIRSFLRTARPRQNRLVNISVIGSALAAAFTVGPAAGGTKFTEGVQALLALPSDSTVWRALCLGAVVLSVVAALATNLANSHGTAAKVSAAETCRAELEGLQVALNFGHIPIDDAVQLYQQYLAKVSFLDEPATV
jgi:hypothetical protein